MAGTGQQQQQMKAQLKAMKLAPSSKPQGIDPTVIIKEREHRYDLIIVLEHRYVLVLCLSLVKLEREYRDTVFYE